MEGQMTLTIWPLPEASNMPKVSGEDDDVLTMATARITLEFSLFETV